MVKDFEAIDPLTCKLVIKVQVDSHHEDLIGLMFNELTQVDSLMTSLYQIRTFMAKQDEVHKLLKGPIDGRTH